jgi:addiction module HigA family antidote
MNTALSITPGEILLEEFLIPMQLSQNKLAKSIKVSPSRINGIIKGDRAITAETALRLSEYFGNSAQFWLNLQSHYDLEQAKATSLKKIKKEVISHQEAA